MTKIIKHPKSMPVMREYAFVHSMFREKFFGCGCCGDEVTADWNRMVELIAEWRRYLFDLEAANDARS